MCGICGIIGTLAEDTVKTMAQAIYHRGPDEEGYFFHNRISLGNRRLSIIDLAKGTQPIFNEDKSIVVVYNGEIYNFQSLRTELQAKGHKFYTNTDTEVIVHSYEEYGVSCLQKFNGDFAFALYDIKNDQTFIARDRLGIKPLYYSIIGKNIIFASELKALLASGIIKKDLNYQSVDKYLTLRYCWGEDTLFNQIKKLPPASYMLVKDGNINIQKYWTLDYTPIKLKSPTDYINRFEELFEESVRLRMISDVPFGAFLSGGVDSSLIVAMMAKHSSLPVETYSIGFNLDIDETEEARKMAEYLGCNHHEIKIDKQSYDLLPEIIKFFDEPLGDAIIIPTYLLAKEASKKLKVILTGEGADEIFGAYIHQLTMHYGDIYNRFVPNILKDRLLLPLVKSAPLNILDHLFPYPSALGTKGKTKLINYLENLAKPTDAYFSIASIFTNSDKNHLYTAPFLQKLDSYNVTKEFSNLLSDRASLPILNQLIDLDTKYWLADYTLFKQDRLTMANSIEGRIPYLDHNLVEFVAQIPVKYKLNGMNTKYLLRKVATSYLPKNIASKPKKAFYFPYQKCFGQDFNIYLKDIFDENSFIINMEIIQKDKLEKLCQDTLNSELLSSKQIMSILILEHWLRIYY